MMCLPDAAFRTDRTNTFHNYYQMCTLQLICTHYHANYMLCSNSGSHTTNSSFQKAIHDSKIVTILNSNVKQLKFQHYNTM